MCLRGGGGVLLRLMLSDCNPLTGWYDPSLRKFFKDHPYAMQLPFPLCVYCIREVYSIPSSIRLTCDFLRPFYLLLLMNFSVQRLAVRLQHRIVTEFSPAFTGASLTPLTLGPSHSVPNSKTSSSILLLYTVDLGSEPK